ncbi:hypothetical protein Btru_038520 [Bulinus truncatus]|nr:hypothetical protein Btru_038520 [Bulinus truncatus]
MATKSVLRPWWLTMRLNGEIVGDWCKPVPDMSNSVICSYCRTLVKVSGINSIKKHAFRKKHVKAKIKISSALCPSKVARYLEPRAWSDFKNGPFPWCKQNARTKKVFCMYCVKILAFRDLQYLNRHAQSNKHVRRAQLIEDASQNFKNDLLGNKMPIETLIKKIASLENRVNLLNTAEEFYAGCFRQCVISEKRILKDLKIQHVATRCLEAKTWSDFKNGPFPWCKQNVKMKKVLCMYCVRVLACKDLHDLKKHAQSKKHVHSARLMERASENFKNGLLGNKMPIVTLIKKINSPENRVNLLNTGEEFNAGCFRQSVISEKQILKDIKIQHDKAVGQEITLSGGMSPTSFNSSVNCYVPLSPVSITQNDHLKNRKLCGQGSGLIQVFMCFYCAREFSSRSALHAHQDACDSKVGSIPPPSGVTSLPRLAPTDHCGLCQCVNTDREVFMSSLGLMPKETAIKMTTGICRKEFESVEMLEDEQRQPNLPRTTKCLLSHLSHDESKPSSPLKRRLSVSSQWVDSNSSGVCDKLDSEPAKVISKLTGADSLYNIDLTSPLGLLVRKLIKGNPALHVLSDVESHCLTSSQVKVFSKDLRQRFLRFPITFKQRLLKFTKHYHLYKFTKRQRQEFMEYVHSGLNKGSRVLLKLVKPCRVRISRLNEGELKRWMLGHKSVKIAVRPLTAGEINLWMKPRTGQAAAAEVVPDVDAAELFPRGLNLNSPEAADVLGLHTTCRLSKRRSQVRLSISNYVSEENMAEMVTSRKVVLKSLLSDAGITESENLPLVSFSPVFTRQSTKHLNSVGPPVTKKCLPDITNFEVDHIKSSVCARTCHPSETATTNAMKNKQLSLGLCKDTGHLVKSAPKSFQVVPVNKNMKTHHGSFRSGVYNVYVRTTKEGEVIRPAKVDVFQKLQSLGTPLRDHNKINLGGNTLAHSLGLARMHNDRSRRSQHMNSPKTCNDKRVLTQRKQL